MEIKRKHFKKTIPQDKTRRNQTPPDTTIHYLHYKNEQI